MCLDSSGQLGVGAVTSMHGSLLRSYFFSHAHEDKERFVTSLDVELRARGLDVALDTTSEAGRLVLHIFASLGDFERELIRERTKEALAAKKRRASTLAGGQLSTPHASK